MATGFAALIPKTKLQADPAAVERAIMAWGGAVQRRTAAYPAAKPTVSGYRRTGTLGRGWQRRLTRSSGDLIVEVRNEVPYAQWVQGQRQSREMARRNWEKVEKIGADLWPGTLGELRRVLSDVLK